MSFKIINSKKTFVPTGTSDLLVNSINKKIKLKGKVLDLGAGNGYVGLKLLHLFKNKFKLFSSDLEKSSLKTIKSNALINKKKVVVKSGNLFAPWKNYKFDFIVNDVSGISKDVAKISPWFKNISCESGKDGTKLTIKIIKESKKFLNKKSTLCFPILSFCNEKKILKILNKEFKFTKKIGQKEWLLPKEMLSKIVLLEKLKKKGYISFKKKFGLVIWTTKIYIAYN